MPTIQENQKPTSIYATYSVGLSVAIESIESALDIQWRDVESYDIKYGQLRIVMTDGRWLNLDLTHLIGSDYKWPISVEEQDKRGNPLPDTKCDL